MRAPRRLAAFGLMALPPLVAAFHVTSTLSWPRPLPRYFQGNPISRGDLSAETVERELGPLLSPGSLIFGPSSPSYPSAIERWISFVQPDIQVVVEPALESDVSFVVSGVKNGGRMITHGGHRSSIATITASTFSREVVDMDQPCL